MALLNMLSNLPGVEVVVAHFNHGIREDSDEDESFVKNAAAHYGLPFESARGKLGKNASEAAARAARYKFLESIGHKHKAAAIITAHHQDDLVETAFINLLRGTGRRGLVALAINPKVVRPLLNWTKKDILHYAEQHYLKWREDKTNQDEAFLRNYVRRRILPRLSTAQRKALINDLAKVAVLEGMLNIQIAKLSQEILKDNSIDRRSFTALPVDLGNELVLHWLRQRQVRQPDKKTIERLNVALRASKKGTVHPVNAGLSLVIGKESAQFSHTL
jgi:tRNA(Ile)-lysidine synthase